VTSQPNKLAEFAAPTRGRVRYAPLTAGLLARKGEAVPATPYFAAEALDLYASSPIMATHHGPVPSHADACAVERETPWAPRRSAALPVQEQAEQAEPLHTKAWRMRRPILPREEQRQERVDAPHSDKTRAGVTDPAHTRPAPHETVRPFAAEESLCIAVSLDIDLDLMARLALHARRAGIRPARIVEEALKSHLDAENVCPTCAQALGPSCPPDEGTRDIG
jgi:hypothetical protein